jgi:RimJ/RimL family protein N-acetyltransferase
VRAALGVAMGEHRHVELDSASRHIHTHRLVLRPWRLDDESAARAIYGEPRVASWLCPALPTIVDAAEMRRVLGIWMAESDAAGLPLGRWAITDKQSGQLIGGVALLPLPPGRTDLEIGWQVAPAMWGHGYGAEAGHAVAHQAFESGDVDEVFAVVRPRNTRAGGGPPRTTGGYGMGRRDRQILRIVPSGVSAQEGGPGSTRTGLHSASWHRTLIRTNGVAHELDVDVSCDFRT